MIVPELIIHERYINARVARLCKRNQLFIRLRWPLCDRQARQPCPEGILSGLPRSGNQGFNGKNETFWAVTEMNSTPSFYINSDMKVPI